MPNIEFEFVEVDNSETNVPSVVENGVEEVAQIEEKVITDDEFEFPLFAAPSVAKSSGQAAQDENTAEEEESRGRSKDKIMKVSLREASIEVIKNERPTSYYRATYSDKERLQFTLSAVSADDIYQQIEIVTPVQDPKPWKCIDLQKYNKEVEKQLQKEKQIQNNKNRAGKKKRDNIIACRERKLERKKIEVKMQKEKDAKIKKKIFHKRGGKKHKKTATKPGAKPGAKPKYRTE